MRPALLLFACLLPAAAHAEVVDEPVGAEPRLMTPVGAPPGGGAVPAHPSLSHKGQFGLSLRTALGLRAIATYQADYCGEVDASTSSGFAPVCTGRVPFSIDLEASYGVTRRHDVFVEMRVGLEGDFGATANANGPVIFKLSPGVRYFFSEGVKTKLFLTGQAVFDFTGYEKQDATDRGNDFGVRSQQGFWVDFRREVGAYVYVAETATFARWTNVELELGIGIQARYP